MAVEVGGTYYFKEHAYYHYIGTVTEILGVRRVALKDVVQVHSCQRSWTLFFQDGFKKDTRFDVIGAAPDFGYISAFAWPHDVPASKE
jgi:hypothetical protein